MFTPPGFGGGRRLRDGAPATVDGYVHLVARLVDADVLAGTQQVCEAVELLKASCGVGGAVLFIPRNMKSLRQNEATKMVTSANGYTVAYVRMRLAAQHVSARWNGCSSVTSCNQPIARGTA